MHFSDNSFNHYFTKALLHSDEENQVRGIYRDKEGTLYAAVWEKLYIQHNNEYPYLQTKQTELMYGIHEQLNTIYLGNYHMAYFNKYQEIIHDSLTKLEISEIWDMDSIDPQHILVAGTHGGYRYHIPTHQFSRIQQDNNLSSPEYCYRIIQQPKGMFYIIAQNGIYSLNNSCDSIVSCYNNKGILEHHKKTTQSVFPFETIYDAYIDTLGDRWICTCGEGLWHWQPKNNRFHQYAYRDGLPSDILYRIEADAKGRLWISSDNGLICFQPETETSMTFSTNSGLSHNEFNRASSYVDHRGFIYFGSINGVNAFHPDSLLQTQSSHDLPMKIIAFSKFSSEENKWVDRTQELQKDTVITLDPGDRLINLEFQLLDFNTKLPVYAYRILELDHNWMYTKENHLSLSGLPYGVYHLTVKGQMSNGLWSKDELHVVIIVEKPFYLKWWFILFSITILSLVFWAIHRWRTKTLQSSKDTLEQEVQNRTYALQQALEQEQTLLKDKEVLLKEIHHRVKNNLQVISGLLELQEKNLQDTNAKQALLEGRNRVRSVALIHQNLYQFENLSGIELNSFVNELYKQVWQVYEQHTSPFSFQTNIPYTEIDIDTAVPLGLMLNELLTNSFKCAGIHSHNVIDVILEMENMPEGLGKKYTLIYHDNGPGIIDGQTIKERKSLGLRLISDLSKQIGGSMTYAYQNGSEFTIRFMDKEARKNRE